MRKRWGYHRYWLAEHHNIPSVASAATAVVIGAVAGKTSTIRVGAGGIMLPNHAPLVIAEQFGTLESLFPGRIDLALGRAPGSDQITARALRAEAGRRRHVSAGCARAHHAISRRRSGQHVRAIPGAGLKVPVWILGSSLYGAQLAAELGLPYAFASHFAPALMMDAIAVYRQRFRPSQFLARPHVMLGVNVVDRRNRRGSEAAVHVASAGVRQPQTRHARSAAAAGPRISSNGFRRRRDGKSIRRLSVSVVGSLRYVQAALEEFIGRTQADELILVAQMYDHAARLRSYELAATLRSRSKCA